MHSLIDMAPVLTAGETPRETWVQILKTGEFDHPKGKIRITRADLQKFKEHFDQKVRGVDLAVDVNHDDNHKAVGWYKEVRIEGDALMARIAWTDEGAQLVASGAYRYFSPEFAFKWTNEETNESFERVLFGGGITNRPFLKNMQPIAASEAGNDAVLWFDPDHDGDDDSTANPKENPDWMDDVRQGVTPWSVCTPEQKQQLIAKGVTKAVAEKAHADFMAKHPHLKMAEEDHRTPGVTDANKTPPKGKPQNRDLYADPDNYKYPIDAKHIRAAVSYFNHPGMREKGGYSAEEWAKIGHRIAAAANRLIGDGHRYADGKIETGTNHHSMADPTSYDPDSIPDEEGGVATPHPIDDTDAGHYHDPKGGIRLSDGSTISLQEWQAQQSRLQMLETENKRHKLSEQVRSWLFDESTKQGKLVPAQHDLVVDLMMTMDDAQAAKFGEFVQSLPNAIDFREHGTGTNITARAGKEDEETKAQKLGELTDKYRKDGMSLTEAYAKAATELGVTL